MGFEFDFSQFLNEESLSQGSASGRQEIVYLDVARLQPSPNEKNFYHTDRNGIVKLARSIEMLGVQQPLVVRPLEDGDTYEVLVGHTRREAVLFLLQEGRKVDTLVPCIVDRSGDDVLQEMALIFTNSTQRERTDGEKMHEAERLRELLKQYKEEHPDFSGNMQQIIADILGISKSKVGRLDNIRHNLSDGLKQSFEAGKINVSTANELSRLDEEEQARMEKKLENQGKLSMREVREACEDEKPETSIPDVGEIAGEDAGNSQQYTIKEDYKVTETHEFSVDWNGYNFLIIYGNHINGWFIAIPNWSISTEAAHPEDVFYNTERLSGAIDVPGAPDILAEAIKEHWRGRHE